MQALSDVSLSVAEGEFVALLGPTGCGKSSLLRLVSDLLPPTSGQVEVRGEPLPRRAASTSSASYSRSRAAVMAHRARQCSPSARSRRLSAGASAPPAARNCSNRSACSSSRNLSARAVRRHEAAGGDRARAGLEPVDPADGRAVQRARRAHESQLQDDLLQLWSRERKTVLFVTHNISEAIYLADRVVVMSPHPGRIKTMLSAEAAAPAHRKTCTRRPNSSSWTRSARAGAEVMSNAPRTRLPSRLRDESCRRSSSSRSCWCGQVGVKALDIPPWLLPAPTDIVDRFFKTTKLWYHTSLTCSKRSPASWSRPFSASRCRPASCIRASSNAACFPT